MTILIYRPLVSIQITEKGLRKENIQLEQSAASAAEDKIFSPENGNKLVRSSPAIIFFA